MITRTPLLIETYTTTAAETASRKPHDRLPSAGDMEQLAAGEHKSWSGWTKWMLSEIEKEAASRPGDGRTWTSLLNSLPCVQRWRRQMATDYAGLSEKEKESDRKEVRKRWALYREAVKSD